MALDDILGKGKEMLDKAGNKLDEFIDSKEVQEFKETVVKTVDTAKEQALRIKDETILKNLRANKDYVKNMPGRFISGRGYHEIRYVKISINRKYVRYGNQKIGIEEIPDVSLDNEQIVICTIHGTTILESNEAQIIVASLQQSQAHLLRYKSKLTKHGLSYEKYPIEEDIPSEYDIS